MKRFNKIKELPKAEKFIFVIIKDDNKAIKLNKKNGSILFLL